jgi:hypothetical protein
MMRTPSCRTILIVLCCCACHSHPPAAPGQTGIPQELISSITIGTYSGHYSKGLLTLAINYISGNIASGYDIHKGLRRNLNGTVEIKDGRLEFVLKEPGGNPYDGTFYLSLDTAADKFSGKWVPSDVKMAKEGPLELERTTYAMNAPDLTHDQWESDLGTLQFGEDGVCTLDYYPGGDSVGNIDLDAQLVTVKGSYEVKGDTIRIDWQRNKRTPTLNMRLIYNPGTPYNDSTETGGQPPVLQGKKVKFEKNIAG